MPQTSIRFNQTATLQSTTIGTDGRPAYGAATSISCAFWRKRFNENIPQVGEAQRVDAMAFLPSGTTVSLRDRFVIGSLNYEVLSVTDAHDDRNRIDHIGISLALTEGV